MEAITITLTPAQATAVRKLSLSSKLSQQELAAELTAQVIRGRFKAKAQTAQEDAAKKYNMAVTMGFKTEVTLQDYVKGITEEYAEILREL
jgi:hypothetical protein